MSSKVGTKKEYLQIYEYAKNYDHSKTLDEIKEYFNYLHDKFEIDYFALYLQICIKKSRPMYLHGYIVSSALQKYIISNPNIEYFNLFETGTARGFSALIMAHILSKNNKKGIINTIDKIGHHEKLYWNCIEDHTTDAPKSRYQILERWKDLRDNYCNFITGESNEIIKNFKNDRIHFAFLDGAHYYQNLKNELEFCEKNQQSGDIIICDDYTKSQFPEIFKAINEFIEKKTYDNKIFFGDDGIKKRGYVYMIKK